MTANELKAWRKARDWTIYEMAERLSVSAPAISRWETGRRAIPPLLYLALQAVECETRKSAAT